MIPVINLKKIQEYNESLSPEERRCNHQRTTDLLEAAIRSDNEYRRICEEKGIPYVSCVAVTKHPMAKHCH